MAEAFRSVLTDAGFLGAFFQTMLLILLGYVLRRRGVLGADAKAPLMTVIWKIAVPCMAFNAFMTDFDGAQFLRGVWVLALTCIAYALMAVAGRLLFARGRSAAQARAFGLLSAIGQLTLFSMPVMRSMYAGESDALIPISIMTIPFRVMVYIVSFFMISGMRMDRRNLAASIKKICLNPIIIGMSAGMLIYLTQNLMPQVTVGGAQYGLLRIDKTLAVAYTPVLALEKLVGPLSMLLIGMSLGQQQLRDALTDAAAWKIAALRMLAAPVLALGLALILAETGLARLGEYELMALSLGMAAPVSVTVSLYCVQYNCAPQTASRACLVSTVLCVLSMPLSCILARMLLLLPCFG